MGHHSSNGRAKPTQSPLQVATKVPMALGRRKLTLLADALRHVFEHVAPGTHK